MKQDLLKSNITKYLDSKCTAGGLYGLTISNESFVDDLIKVIALTRAGGTFELPKDNNACPCPKCGEPLLEKWSGTKCTSCDYWFCF